MTTHLPDSSARTRDAALSDLAAEAFIYGFPLVFDLRQVQRIAREGLGNLPATGVNDFGHAGRLAGPEEKFVTINNDTLYSIAQIDVSGGPVRLQIPDTHDRYYVMQFIDAWTNNFAYVGHRATGTHAQSYLLIAPDWDGDAPDGVPVIRFPTTIGTILGRWAVSGPDDVPAVVALQRATTLTESAPGRGIPQPDGRAPEHLRFWEELRVAVQSFPPAERDRAYQERFAPLGLFEPESPYVNPSEHLAAALREGVAKGNQILETAPQKTSAPKQNGWNLTYHIFDYNLDFFEVGTIDDPKWKADSGQLRYLRRAAAARAALWGNHAYEAAYAQVYVDSEGEQLNGTHSYELRFASPPPCGAFWSVTMYDRPDFYLVPNPIERYSIGDRTPGLHTAADGSLTIVLQHDDPDEPERKANWLPAPAGEFRPILRMYEPDDTILDGSYELPPITRVR
jgi:hypothetical protein